MFDGENVYTSDGFGGLIERSRVDLSQVREVKLFEETYEHYSDKFFRPVLADRYASPKQKFIADGNVSVGGMNQTGGSQFGLAVDFDVDGVSRTNFLND
jgi:hypothetical protein